VNATLHRLDADGAAELAREVEPGYADGMERQGGIPREAARRKAAADCAKLLADETGAAFRIEVEGERAGYLWVGEQTGPAGRMLWIYDVFVDEAFRGRGLGRKALLLAEDEARRRGLDLVGLNVFGGNEVARGLYRSLGYDEVAVLMRKDVR
jgi:ribosomal protein S18 acetylase RimI-like enzyme